MKKYTNTMSMYMHLLKPQLNCGFSMNFNLVTEYREEVIYEESNNRR